MKSLFQQNRSIRTKLILIMFLLVGTPLVVFGYVWYERSTTAIEHNSIQSSQQLLRQTKEYMSFYLADLKKATMPLLANPYVQEYVKASSPPSDRYDHYIESKRIQEEAFGQVVNGRSDLFGISLISQYGRQEFNYSQVKGFIDMSAVKERNKQLWESREDLDSYEILDMELYQSTPVLTIVQKIYDQHTYDTSGLLIVHLRLNQLATILNDGMVNHFNDIWLVDHQNTILYHPDSSQVGQTYQKQLMQTTHSFFIDQFEKKKTLMVTENIPHTNWTMMASVPLKETMVSLMEFRNFTIWIGLILIGIAIIVVGGFSFSLTYSLRHLQNLMKKVASGQFTGLEQRPSAYDRKDEIGELYKSFYRMTYQLSSLIDEMKQSKLKEQELQLKTKEAELQAMQSQINPHFLYNTLEIINSYAIIEQQMNISRMTTSLADMFRYNVSNKKPCVTLAEELQHIRSYFQIQLERFETLEVMYDVDERVTPYVQTARLTLQPLIENAFSHGYEEHSLEPHFIGIFGKEMENCYMIYLVDRGKGMSPELLESFNYAFVHNAEPPEAHKTTKRIGMMNVHKRIHSSFGVPYGLYIKKSDQHGTVLEIRLPYRTEEVQKEA